MLVKEVIMRNSFIIKSLVVFFFLLRFTGNISAQDFETINFVGKDSIHITADFYSVEDKHAPTILLFHQFKASRGEYRDIAPVLVAMGFNCFAIDTRAGGTDYWNNVENETSKNSDDVGRNFLAAYPDIQSSIDNVKEQDFTGKIIIWGSSFSSTLVLKYAEENEDKIAGVLSFSPGEYIDGKNGIVADWAGKIKKLPVFVACGSTESKRANPIFSNIQSKNKSFYVPTNGRHGSSILLDDAKNWKPVKEFLAQFFK